MMVTVPVQDLKTDDLLMDADGETTTRVISVEASVNPYNDVIMGYEVTTADTVEWNEPPLFFSGEDKTVQIWG